MRTRTHRIALSAVSLLAVVGVACGTAETPVPAAAPVETEPVLAEDPDLDTGEDEGDGTLAPEPTDDPAPPASGDQGQDFDIRLDGAKLEFTVDDGALVSGWTLSPGSTWHAYLVRPGSTAEQFDAVVIELQGERPVLHHLSNRGETSALTIFPDHLQPAHELDAAPPMLEWTPDARSLLWTEPTSEGVTLRGVGWDGGPGTGRTADDNASFVLDAALGDVHLDGVVVGSDGTWTLLLRPGAGGDPIELPIERQADGALALPTR